MAQDKNRYNLLYKPDLSPIRDWRSEAVFEHPDIPVFETPPETVDDVLQDLKDLEEVAAGLPEGLEPVAEIVQKLRQRAEILKIEEELEKLVTPSYPTSTVPGTETMLSTPGTVPGYPGTSTLTSGSLPGGGGGGFVPPGVTVQPPTIQGGGTVPGYPGTLPGHPVTLPGGSTLPGVPGTLPGTGTVPGIPGTIPGYPGTIPGYPGSVLGGDTIPGYPGSLPGADTTSGGGTGSIPGIPTTGSSLPGYQPGSGGGISLISGSVTGGGTGIPGGGGPTIIPLPPVTITGGSGTTGSVQGGIPGIPGGMGTAGGTISPITLRPGTVDGGGYGTTSYTTINSGDIGSSDKDTIPAPGTIIIPDVEQQVLLDNITDPDTSWIKDMTSIFVPKTDITISVQTPKSLVQVAHESYKSDQLDLQKFYLQKMRMALQRYFHHILGLTIELGLSDPDMLTKKYDGNNVEGIGINSNHLHDTIIRSQIQRLQKARFFKKIANADLTVTHMRAWNAAAKERERYYTEAYGDSAEFVDSEANVLLRQARSDYDAAYKLSLYNMYKYLDASVKLTEDILDHTLVEAKAKAKLVKEGVDIFKTEEVDVSTDNNAVTRMQPKTKEQKEAEDRVAQQQDSQAGVTLTPEEIDKARGIEDPDEDFDLAPSGGHYSKNDILYLCNLDAALYNKETAIGRQAIKNVLNQSDKYMKGSDTTTDNTTTTGSGISPSPVTASTGTTPSDIIVATSMSGPVYASDVGLDMSSIPTATTDTTQSTVEQESKNKVEEITGTNDVSANETTSTTASSTLSYKKFPANFTPDLYVLNTDYEDRSAPKSNLLANTGGYYASITATGNTVSARITSPYGFVLLWANRKDINKKEPEMSFEDGWNLIERSEHKGHITKDMYKKVYDYFVSYKPDIK